MKNKNNSSLKKKTGKKIEKQGGAPKDIVEIKEKQDLQMSSSLSEYHPQSHTKQKNIMQCRSAGVLQYEPEYKKLVVENLEIRYNIRPCQLLIKDTLVTVFIVPVCQGNKNQVVRPVDDDITHLD